MVGYGLLELHESYPCEILSSFPFSRISYLFLKFFKGMLPHFYVVTWELYPHVMFYTGLWYSQMWAISQILMIPLSTFSSKLWCFMEPSYNIFIMRPLKGCSNSHHGLVCFWPVLLLVPFYFTWVHSNSNVGNQPNCDDSPLTLSPNYDLWNFIQYICCASFYFQQWQNSCIL